MVNTIEFAKAVDKSGMTLRAIAKRMGISYQSLYRKSRNKTIFRISEVEMFCRIVGVSTKTEKEQIFCA